MKAMAPEEYPSATEFLPNLPKANLDDRSFDDLVEECILRIPRYCPEWTNYNPGDPGITLVELFAWLVHQMLYRFNQVPQRHYVAFLELLGIRLLPPRPASVELTFYLSKAQVEPKLLRVNTEVATVRTERQKAIVFTTDRDLVIGQPKIKHMLIASTVESRPTRDTLINRFDGTEYERERQWNDLATPIELFQPCKPGSCFYWVFSTDQGNSLSEPAMNNISFENISGNILAITFKGQAAVTTGINTNNPPLRWEAWTGSEWQSGILRQPSDDRTKGFSFDSLGEDAPNPELEGADIILHLPQAWSSDNFDGYEGYWIRCVYIEPNGKYQQFGYERSPEIIGTGVRSIGGMVQASESITIENESLGMSAGRPGQSFQLSATPVLQRRAEEYVEVHLLNGEVEVWTEVEHFGDSGPEDRHYLIDSQNGQVQFGPLIRESSQLVSQIRARRQSQVQSWGRSNLRQPDTQMVNSEPLSAFMDDGDRRAERQYGAVPAMDAEIYMKRYRVGGGSRGNIKAEQLTVLKSSVPYIKRAVNYSAAEGGVDSESLDQAIMRVPAILRTRKTALTPEEFEQTARRFEGRGGCRIQRAHYISSPYLAHTGIVNLAIVPAVQDSLLNTKHGLHPNCLKMSDTVLDELQSYLDIHKALGVRVKPHLPQYVAIKVQAQIIATNKNLADEQQNELGEKICQLLYHFLNPITGGFAGEGWPLKRSVRSSDIILQLQATPDIDYVGSVKLSAFKKFHVDGIEQWRKVTRTPKDTILLDELEIPCSWKGQDALYVEHELEFIAP